MRKLLWFTLGFSAACLASVYLLPELGLPWAAGFGAALLLGLLIFRCLRRKRPASDGLAPAPRRLLCAALGLGLGLIWCWAYDALIQAPARRAAGEYADLTAELRDYPVPTDYGHRAELWVELPEGRVSARLYLYGALPELEPGDCLRGPMKLRRADRGADGETELWLPAAGFLLTGSCRPESYAKGGGLRYFPVRLSYQIFQRLEALLPEDAAALPQAMLTGRREGLSEADRSLLSAAGASHIVAVSGLDRHADGFEDSRMMRIGEGFQFRVLAVDGAGVLRQIVGSDGEEVAGLSQLISAQDCRGRLDIECALIAGFTVGVPHYRVHIRVARVIFRVALYVGVHLHVS